jgi:predicted transcriptional regulator
LPRLTHCIEMETPFWRLGQRRRVQIAKVWAARSPGKRARPQQHIKDSAPERDAGERRAQVHIEGPRRPRVIRAIVMCMTMLSFRVPDEDAAEVAQWAALLGVDRSAILRDALHRHLVLLKSEADVDRWLRQPATESERALGAIADWGPAEDWSDWRDAQG